MEENFKDAWYIKKLAIISDALDSIAKGKKIVVFELDRESFDSIKSTLSDSNNFENQFKIEISENEFLHLLSE
jgi:hypothetical protein